MLTVVRTMSKPVKAWLDAWDAHMMQGVTDGLETNEKSAGVRHCDGSLCAQNQPS